MTILLMMALMSPATTETEAPPLPPIARRIPHATELHGDQRVDDYFWLREKGRPEVTAQLEAENAYTASVMKPTEAFQETLYREMLSHIQETDVSAPYPDGPFFYFTKTQEGLQYPIFCRRPAAPPAAPEQVTVDVNALAKGEPFMALGAYVVSDDGRLLAYTTDNTGFRQYRLAVKDLDAGQVLADRAERVTSVAWAADNRTLFYTVEDDAKRSYRLYRHRLGDGAADDALVFEEPDERFSLVITRTRSRAFLILYSHSHTASEARLLPADRPTGEWRVAAPRRPEHEYYLDHRGDRFYVRTNDRGRTFRVVTAPVDSPGEASWTEVVPHRPEVMLEELLLFAGHAVLFEREGGLSHARILDLESGQSHRVGLPEPVYAVTPGENRVFETRTLRFVYESLVTPSSVFDYDMQVRERRLVKQRPVPGYDASLYESERLHATAPDGVRVPISLVRRKGTPRDGSAPLLLYGYGAYGYSIDPRFSSSRLALLDRGVSFAIAHVRGGGELGKPWHDQGRMLNKKNTFTDFVAAAEALVAAGHTSPARLAIEGGSAGGLLIGAVLNLRPDLFRAAHLAVPFVDVVNTMLDETLPLTVGEFEEWGNPKKPDEYAYIKSYCPYTNLARASYPAILVTTSLNDSQVMYWEPAKYVAKLRGLKTDERPLLFKINMAAGHGGASGRYDYLHETAFEYAFVLRELGAAR